MVRCLLCDIGDPYQLGCLGTDFPGSGYFRTVANDCRRAVFDFPIALHWVQLEGRYFRRHLGIP